MRDLVHFMIGILYQILPRGFWLYFKIRLRCGRNLLVIRPPFGNPSANSATMQPLSNSDTDATNRHATASQPQPRLNHPSCRIQERFRLNHPTSVILQLRQRRAAWPWLVHQLPRPSRHFLHHPRREGDRQAAGNGVITAAGE